MSLLHNALLFYVSLYTSHSSNDSSAVSHINDSFIIKRSWHASSELENGYQVNLNGLNSIQGELWSLEGAQTGILYLYILYIM